jgi:hypothetical protein
MKKVLKLLMFLLLCFDVQYLKAQPGDTTDFYKSIKKFDLSILWKCDRLTINVHDIDDSQKMVFFGPEKIRMPEILGFIGNDFERFYIHYISIKKSTKTPYQYIVRGKTRVDNDIRSFKGTITIKKAYSYIDDDLTNVKQGIAISKCRFYEDSSKAHSGFITGKLVTSWYLNKGVLIYNDIYLQTDGYANNQFMGVWKSYKGNQTKKCNWGDFRIPNSGDLDIGAGEFGVNDKYLKNGWQSFWDAFISGDDSIKTKKALVKENEQWWK